MSVIKTLRTCLMQTGWTVRQDAYPDEGKQRADRYIIYNLSSQNASGFADDMPMEDISYVQVHIYLPLNINPKLIKKEVKSRLFKAGFSYPRLVLDTREEDAGMRHICFETNITEKTEV